MESFCFFPSLACQSFGSRLRLVGGGGTVSTAVGDTVPVSAAVMLSTVDAGVVLVGSEESSMAIHIVGCPWPSAVRG